MSSACITPGQRDGFSLLEVVLALAILTGSIAVLGEVVRLGLRNAQVARDMSQAQLLCESKMAEITSGITPAEPVSQAAFDPLEVAGETGTTLTGGEETWLYSIETEVLDEDGLMAVRVIVTQGDEVQRPVRFKLVRWMLDSAAEASTESAAEDSESANSDTGGGSE